MDPHPRETLMALLDSGLSLSPEYADGLSSHLPMALSALQALGASSARLREFDRFYRTRLAPRRRRAPVSQAQTDPWAGELGRFDRFEALAQSARQAIDREGLRGAVRRRLPMLMPGVAAALFHGVIRTAYAVSTEHPGETAVALGFWAARHRTLGAADGRGADGIPGWLGRLRELRAAHRVAGPPFTGRMKAWSDTPGFAAAAGSLAVTPETLPALARCAAGLYAESGDFVVLHVVTGCQAMLALWPELGEPEAAIRHFVPAVAGALLVSSALERQEPAAGTAPAGLPWPALIARAIGSSDEHVIKLVHASHWLHGRLGGDAFRLAASRAVEAEEVTPA